MIPRTLRIWFVIHFVVDLIFAVPLVLAPVWLLTSFGFETVQPVTARLVGAALIAIGGTSLLVRHKGTETYRTMLTLKIIWSLAAISGLLISILEGAPTITWLFVVIFSIFFGVWRYYRKRV